MENDIDLFGLGKCAFITGGSRGIGRGIAAVLASHGFDIAFTYSTALDEAKSLCAEIESMGRRCFYYQASLELPDVPTAVTKIAIADLGRLDVLVNNAGITRHNRIPDTTAEFIDFVYGLNFRNAILCSAVASKHMLENGIKGNIINITSSRGERGYPTDSIYGGFKAALKRSTESMALELSSAGIRVNAVAPGMTRVRGDNINDPEAPEDGWVSKIPLGRSGTPREVGHAIAFLVSDKAAYITGISLRIDGGLIIPGMPEDGSPESGYGWGRVRYNPNRINRIKFDNKK